MNQGSNAKERRKKSQQVSSRDVGYMYSNSAEVLISPGTYAQNLNSGLAIDRIQELELFFRRVDANESRCN